MTVKYTVVTSNYTSNLSQQLYQKHQDTVLISTMQYKKWRQNKTL